MAKNKENREQVEIFSIEEFVPTDHLLRKIDSAVDFTHMYDIVEDLYCVDNGRSSIDPDGIDTASVRNTVFEKNSRRN